MRIYMNLNKYYELKDEKHSLEGAKFGIYATEEDAKNNKITFPPTK